MSTYTGKVSDLGYWTRSEPKKHREMFLELAKRKLEGKPVYVRWKNDARRRGAIGLLSSYDIEDVSHWYNRTYDWKTGQYIQSNAGEYFQAINLEVTWEGRKNRASPHEGEIEILDDYEGPTIWAWNTSPKEAKPIPTITDHLGAEVNVDDFVSFVSRRYGVIELHFGNVSRINHNGSVWVNTLKLRDDDDPQERKVHDTDTIVKIGKDLVDRLMMARLAAR